MATIKEITITDGIGITVISDDERAQRLDIFDGPNVETERKRFFALIAFNGLTHIDDTDQLLGKTFVEIKV